LQKSSAPDARPDCEPDEGREGLATEVCVRSGPVSVASATRVTRRPPPGFPDGSTWVPYKESDSMNALKNFIAGEEGQDLVEYALLAALLSIASITALKVLGPKIAATWGKISAEL